MTEKERFSFLSRCITLQSLQSLKNEQLRMLTDDFKEPEVRHILITQANARGSEGQVPDPPDNHR